MGDYSDKLAYMQQMTADQQRQALMQQLAGMSNQVGGLLAGSQQQQSQLLAGNLGIPNGVSAATAAYPGMFVKPKPAPEKKPKKLSNLEWLDQRVNEMRVRL